MGLADHRALLAAELDEHRARLAALDADRARSEAHLGALGANARRLERTLPLIGERARARRILADQGHGSRLAWLELEQQHIDRQQELAELRLRQDETRASIAALLEQRARIESEFRRHVRARLVELERLAISLMQELAKADQHLAYQRLIAPIDGVVHQLAVHTIGGVVNAGETLMLIVPENDALEIEAMVPNRDIGFIAVGQRAELRLEAFPYTIYGTLGGRVRDIGRDAVDDPRLGLVFPTRVALDRAAIRVEGRDIALVPGMRATIDIVTERRRVAEVLLAPLLRLRHEAMRER
jgi:hemolysin D